MFTKKIITIAFFLFNTSIYAQNNNQTDSVLFKENRLNTSVSMPLNDTSVSKVQVGYGNKGWEFGYDNRFLMRMQWRLQFRVQFHSKDIGFFVPEEDDLNGSFNVQRARLKVGGYSYQKYLKYYLEYDFPSTYLLNWEFTFAKFKAIQFKLGQWKIKYNTERYISSGKQQFVDRSISNRFFTFDRQIGVLLQGDVFTGRVGSSSYNLGIFNGNGRMATNNDGKFMFFGRYQWNFSRKPISMFFSELDKVNLPQGFIAFAYVHNQSAYTRFSSDGGGQLPGYSDGDLQQYVISQFNVELMFKYKGFSFASETHIKNIDDKVLLLKSQLYGGYAMAGYFLSELFKFIPSQIELSGRYARVNNKTFYELPINEYSIGLNYFFNGHSNKLTFDFSYIENQDFVDNEDNFRFRLQWDVSF